MSEEKDFEIPTYGKLCSVRHQAMKTNELLNAISCKFGVRIRWFDSHRGAIDRKDMPGNAFFFYIRGNRYANYLDLTCTSFEILSQVKAAFPDDFPSDVQIKEGLC